MDYSVSWKAVVKMKALEFAMGTNFILPQDMHFFLSYPVFLIYLLCVFL